MEFARAEMKSVKKKVMDEKEGLIERRVMSWVKKEEGEAGLISPFGTNDSQFNVSNIVRKHDSALGNNYD